MAQKTWQTSFIICSVLSMIFLATSATNSNNPVANNYQAVNEGPPIASATDFSSPASRFKSWPKDKVYNLTLGIVVSDRSIIQDFLIPFFEEINNESPVANKPTVILKPVYDQPDLPTKAANPIEAVLKICERFVQGGIGALVLRNENQDLMTPVAISYTLSFYKIPILSINDRNNIFSDKSIHSMFMRTVPAYSEQALLMLDIVQHFGWSRVAVLATNDVNGRNFLSNLFPAIQRRNIKYSNDDHVQLSNACVKVEPYFPFDAGNKYLIKFHLMNLKKSTTRVALVYGSREDCQTIAIESQKLNISSSFVWIFNDLVISDISPYNRNLQSIPPGILVPRLKHVDDTVAHLIDAIKALKSSYQSLIRKLHTNPSFASPNNPNPPPMAPGTRPEYSMDPNAPVDEAPIAFVPVDPVPPPNECGGEGSHWVDGHKFLKEIKQYKQNPAETGDLAFNSESGDRINSEYEILNTRLLPPSPGAGGTGAKLSLVPVGTWSANEGFQIDQSQPIIWPNGSPVKPQGVVVSKHLRIVTAITEPFVNRMRAFPNRRCDNILRSQPDVPNDAIAVPCKLPPYGDRNETEYWCCYGYCIDLLIKLEEQLQISYDLHIVADEKFGSRSARPSGMMDGVVGGSSGQGAGKSGGGGPMGGYGMNGEMWDGTIGEILSNSADLIVAALTIDNERAQVIDFSNPFKHQGLSIVVKKKQPNSSLASFIQPFQYQLWILIALSVHVVALILYLLDRFSPFGRFKVKQDEGGEEEDALNLSSAMWFAWGVLLNSGIGEGTPRSFSARVLGVVWAGFAMIIVASYTANLAAFLVLDRPEAEIAGINDARMRNPSEAYKYGTVRNSAVQAYFKRKVEMSNMYRFMLKYSKDTAKEAIDDVKKGDLDAFIWDSAVLDYETSRDCSLVTVGEMFHRSGYGIGMAKDSAWKEKISLEILQFHEDGFMETLDNKWMKLKTCDNTDSQPATLGLENMAGVFMLVGGGIVAGVVLIFIEMAYKRHYGKQEREEVVARAAFDRWRSAAKNKSRGNGDGGASYIPSSYTLGNQEPCEAKLNQLFGGPGSASGGANYFPMRQNNLQQSASSFSNKDHLHSQHHNHPSSHFGAEGIKSPPHFDGPMTSHHNGPMTGNNNTSFGGGPANQQPAHLVGGGAISGHHSLNNRTPGNNYPSSSHFASGVSSPLDYSRGGGPQSPVAVANKQMGNNISKGGGGGLKMGGGSKPVPPTRDNQKLPKNNCLSSNPSPTTPVACNTNNNPNTNDSNLSAVTLDLKLFDPDFVREKSSAGRISAKSSRGDLHLT